MREFMIHAPEILTTERLVLRRPRLSDAAAIFAEYAQDSEVIFFQCWRDHREIKETVDFLAGCLARWESGEELTWGLTQKDNDRVVGMVACRICGHERI